jgi:hypothetical protein
VNKKDSIAILIRSRKKLSLTTVESAWKLQRRDNDEEARECAGPEEDEEISDNVLPDARHSGTEDNG